MNERINMKTWLILVTCCLLCSCSGESTATNVSSVVTVEAEETFGDHLNEYCWNDQHACSIIGNFTRKTIGLSIAVNINCLEDAPIIPIALVAHKASLHRRFHSIEFIHLNGCGVNGMQRNSFGIEHIPDQENVLQLTLEMFKIEREIKRGAFKRFKKLESLTLLNNLLLSGINRTTFGDLVALKQLVLESNQLTALDERAFDDFASTLTHLIIRESTLQLNYMTPLHNVTHAELTLAELNWASLFTSLRTLKMLRVEQTHITNTSEHVQPCFEQLIELHLVYDNLVDIPFNQYPNLVHLNISHNRMEQPSFDKNNLIVLQHMDVSYNHLTAIDEHLLASLLQLETFVASHNRIAVIKRKAFNRNLYIRLIDVSHNQLKVLNVDVAIFLMATQLKILIDDNPWSCVWVINFSANEPHIFSMKFVYTKYSDRINMRGLKCQFYANDEMMLQHHYHMLDDTHLHHNHTAQMPMLPAGPASPGTKRRNTKHTAVITIVILVVGVTVLLLMLYVHIKCRPMATSLQSPFYRTLPTNHCSSGDRADIVRRILPPTDYESPLSERMKNLSAESINDAKPDASLFTDIDLKDLYEEIPERRVDDDDCMRLDLDLDDFSYRFNSATTDTAGD